MIRDEEPINEPVDRMCRYLYAYDRLIGPCNHKEPPPTLVSSAFDFICTSMAYNSSWLLHPQHTIFKKYYSY